VDTGRVTPKRRATREMLVHMTNITVKMKEAEEHLVEGHMDAFCADLHQLEDNVRALRTHIESKKEP